MGEQPIFSTKAHVFQIDPSTKKRWLPASTQAIIVSYYYDSTRNTYRIISVEGSKAVINSTIGPNMTFTKTSQKFGQWSDSRANTVYGLGFATEADLAKFIEKFKEIKELTRQSQSQEPSQTNGTEDDHAPPDISGLSIVQNAAQNAALNSSSNSSPVHERHPSLPSNPTEAQLKYENDRLKIALAQSSTNAKKWEVELQTLKNNNARLTTALQESTSNVEEWKKQLAAYKEESARMKKKVQELEKAGGNTEVFARQVGEMAESVRELERTNRQKQEDVTELTRKVDQLQPYETQSKQLSDRVKIVEKENERLKKDLIDVQKKFDDSKSSQSKQSQRLATLQQQISSKYSELYQLHDQLMTTVQDS